MVRNNGSCCAAGWCVGLHPQFLMKQPQNTASLVFTLHLGCKPEIKKNKIIKKNQPTLVLLLPYCTLRWKSHLPSSLHCCKCKILLNLEAKCQLCLGLCFILCGVPSPKVEKLDTTQRNPEAVKAWEEKKKSSGKFWLVHSDLCLQEMCDGERWYCEPPPCWWPLNSSYSKLYLGGNRKGNKDRTAMEMDWRSSRG